MTTNSGYIVKTKTGKKGIVYHREEAVKGKVIVHLFDHKEELSGLKMLCFAPSLDIIGFND